jgi:hypothetical protein
MTDPWQFPEHARRRFAARSSNRIPVRVELFQSGGAMKANWYGIPSEVLRDCNHRVLCEILGLPVHGVRFDMPSAFRGVGSNTSGYGGSTSGSRIISAVILDEETREAIGKMSIVRDWEKFWDYDPESAADFFNLGRA